MKKLSVLVLVVISMVLLTGCGTKKIDWSEITLGDKMPKSDVLTGEIETNRKDLAIIEITKISQKEFESYVQKVIDAGYDIDLEYEDWDTVYGAFNKEGYSIRISYLENSKEMSITLETPETNNMKEIEWPSNGLGAMLPKPKSNLGKISWNNSDTFIVHLGNTTINDFNEYVKACEAAGYTNDYSKEDKYYSAKNSSSYELDLRYLGANVIEISLKAPEGVENNSTSVDKPVTDNKPTTDNSKMRSDFKKAMDDYEKFMDEYIAFMKKYNKSNGSDLSLLSDYSDYMTKYTEFLDSFSKWESKDLNEAEAKYYLEVQTRVNKKLLEIS